MPIKNSLNFEYNLLSPKLEISWITYFFALGNKNKNKTGNKIVKYSQWSYYIQLPITCRFMNWNKNIRRYKSHYYYKLIKIKILPLKRFIIKLVNEISTNKICRTYPNFSAKTIKHILLNILQLTKYTT